MCRLLTLAINAPYFLGYDFNALLYRVLICCVRYSNTLVFVSPLLINPDKKIVSRYDDYPAFF